MYTYMYIYICVYIYVCMQIDPRGAAILALLHCSKALYFMRFLNPVAWLEMALVLVTLSPLRMATFASSTDFFLPIAAC